MSEWITRNEAVALLGIRPQTLYAYVSRKLVAARPDPAEPRSSCYSKADVDRLLTRRSRGRRVADVAEQAISWGEPVLPTAISTVSGGRLFYRGRDVAKLASDMTFEQVAALLWDSPHFPQADRLAKFDPVLPPVEAALAMLASVAARSEPTTGRAPVALAGEAALVLRSAAAALGSDLSGMSGIVEGFVRRWNCGADAARTIRTALIVMADHELNASTFAARVTASTGAPLAAAALAGLSAFLGPAHGAATLRVRNLFDAAARIGARRAIQETLARGEPLPGFGHPLYPEIDPRAAILFETFALPDLPGELARHAAATTGLRPNVDFATVAMATACELPDDAPFRIFAAARMAGWLAHAMEQALAGHLIRPRARYTGPPLERS